MTKNSNDVARYARHTTGPLYEKGFCDSCYRWYHTGTIAAFNWNVITNNVVDSDIIDWRNSKGTFYSQLAWQGAGRKKPRIQLMGNLPDGTYLLRPAPDRAVQRTIVR